jgi:hypothetical protein
VKELDSFALRLLQFAEDSVNEALDDPTYLMLLLSEADDAFRILKSVLRREDPTKHTQLIILGVFDPTLEEVASRHPLDIAIKLRDALREKMVARRVFFE